MTLDDYFAGTGAKTPASLAEEVGISESTLSRIRNGKQNTTRDVILKIIDATGGRVTADGLLGLHDRHSGPEWPIQSANNGGEIIGGEQQPPALAAANSIGGDEQTKSSADAEGGHGHPFHPSSATCSQTSARPRPSPASPACSAGEADAA
jgi:transcriptional regulator with XRE-family HTH domain